MTRGELVRGVILSLVVAVVAPVAAARFSPPQPRPAASVGAVRTETEAELSARVAKLQSHLAALTKTVKVIADNQALFARSVMVEPNGTVRITGNVRFENNVLDEVTLINCDEGSLTGKRQCTCPEAFVAIGIELRPLELSAFPGPATYNTAILCGRP